MKYAFAEKRKGMSFHVAGKFVEANSLEDFMKTEEIKLAISLSEKFGDSWQIIEFEENPNLPNKLVHKGNSEK